MITVKDEEDDDEGQGNRSSAPESERALREHDRASMLDGENRGKSSARDDEESGSQSLFVEEQISSEDEEESEEGQGDRAAARESEGATLEQDETIPDIEELEKTVLDKSDEIGPQDLFAEPLASRQELELQLEVNALKRRINEMESLEIRRKLARREHK